MIPSKRYILPTLLLGGIVVVAMTQHVHIAGNLFGAWLGTSTGVSSLSTQNESMTFAVDQGGLFGDEGYEELIDDSNVISSVGEEQNSDEKTPTFPPRLPPAGLVCNARVRKLPVTPHRDGPYFFYEWTGQGNTAAAAEKDAKDGLPARAQAKCAQNVNDPALCATGCTDGGVTALFTPFKNNPYLATAPTGLMPDGVTFQATFKLLGQCVTTRTCSKPPAPSGGSR